ncbi:complex I NDUFA9 subunit family protein [Sulfuriflexus sp.]|uniref:complex I NDUFA9 subunit family protein n=1 Tax=Sulfuriflexus sp. TaxID=2015443 RepID=UPI0028CEF552|nr:complex I NDUFA9 subunit family protein [Sulfuriflexus sp.]MDT8404175.1 complex I NDUFA9 subunit family protein [Sulfuriflexus sp.]
MKRICILGGSGFVGKSLCRLLAGNDWLVRVPSRRPASSNPMLQTLPGVETVQCDIHDPSQLATLLTNCDDVVNLVGILNEPGNDGSGFQHAHVELARKVIEACQNEGITRLLHMSALHANAERGPSHYLRSKGQAEQLVIEAGEQDLQATRFRPSIIFGPNDSFFNRFAYLLRFAPVFPLACPDARFAPVYVEDVARAFMRSLHDDSTIGQGYDLCGPKTYTLKELVSYTAMCCGYRRVIIGLNDSLSRLQAKMLGLLPGKPMSYDNYLSLTVDSVCDEPFPSRFGTPTAIEEVVPEYLYRG